MVSVRASIFGRPRRLPSDRRADHLYTLNCEEPLDLLTGILIGSTLAETPADPDTGDSEGDGFISSPDDGAGETGDDGSFFE